MRAATSRRRALAALGAALIAAPAAAVAADTSFNGPANTVEVDNSVDATTRSDAEFQVARAQRRDTEAGNLAFAHSHDCTGCKSLAAAYQAVFVSPDNTSFSPQNVAAAVNSNCTGCGSFAYAYQYVVTADRSVRLSESEREQVDQLEREASRELRSGDPFPQIDATLHDVAQRFRAVVDGAIARAKIRVEDRRSREDRHDEGG